MQKLIQSLLSILLFFVALNSSASNVLCDVAKDKESSREINMSEHRCQDSSKKSRSIYKIIEARLFSQSNTIELNFNTNINIAYISITYVSGNVIVQEICNTMFTSFLSINLPFDEGDYIITISNEHIYYEGHFFL